MYPVRFLSFYNLLSLSEKDSTTVVPKLFVARFL